MGVVHRIDLDVGDWHIRIGARVGDVPNMIRALAIALALVASGCATTASTTSISVPFVNDDGTITFAEDGSYPKKVTVEVKARAGVGGSLESWMLDTDITRNEDGTITFHTGNIGAGLAGVDPEKLAALVEAITGLIVRGLAELVVP